MPHAPKPRDEARRLAALRAEAVLDTAREDSFDRIARLGSAVFDGLQCYVGFLDETRVWVKAAIGLDGPTGTPREESFSAHVVLQKDVLWVEDAIADPRFATLPTVTGDPYVRFFAGAPIQGADGRRVGVLGVIAPVPHAYDAARAAQLGDLAELVSDMLALRRGRREIAHAARAREAAEAATEAFIDHAPIAMAMFDNDMNYVRVSPRWEADYRVPAAELIGCNHYERLPSALRYVAEHRRALAGQEVRGEGCIVRADGTPRHSRYEMAPWRDAHGAIGGILLTSCDISDIVAAREAAERSERRLQLALDISETIVWEAVLPDRELHVSGPIDHLFNVELTFDKLVTGADKFAHVDDRKRCRDAWSAHLETGVPYRETHRQALDEGGERWVQSFVEARYDGDGAMERIIGVFKDVTAQKSAEGELIEARAAAEAANTAKSEFLANMSHELRTPLNGVAGVASALAATELAPAQREMVTLIEDSAAALERLLSDVLDLARVESGRVEIRTEPLELRELVAGAAGLFQWRARDKGVELGWRVAPELDGRWLGDVVRLRQILTNLVANAVKFTAEGTVQVEVALAPDGRIAFEVRDTGIGFDDEVKARLFDRFVQADGSITRRYGGTGLGLAIARSLTARMGGVLEATSAPGRGSVFRLELPLARVPEPAREPLAFPAPRPAAASIAAGSGPRVLLAEDHPTNRRVVQLILSSADAQLHCVEDGLEAITAWEGQPFDVILMDMQMPRMDGLTALRAIREAEVRTGRARTPAVVLTANALPEHVRSALDAGADAHLAKPVTAAALLDAVARLSASEPQLALAG